MSWHDGVMQNEAYDDEVEQQSMHGLIVEHAYTVNAATTVISCIHSYSFNVEVDIAQLQTDREASKQAIAFNSHQ